MNTYPETREALVAYDAADAAYGAESPSLSFGECWTRINALEALAAGVGTAFAHDTADFNVFDTASLMRPSPWLRRLLDKPQTWNEATT